MATEKLVLELNAKVDDAIKDLDDVKHKLDKADASSDKLDKSFKTLTTTAKATADAAFTVAKATAAVVAAATAAAGAIAMQARELKINADLMNMSVERAQAYSAATKTVGIDLDKLGDISKDVSERIGEMTGAGAGGMQDFADHMGMGIDETIKFSEALKGMAGADVLGEVVKQMEAAGKSEEEVSQALEALASDTTRLIPLLTNNSAKLKELTADYNEYNNALSESDIAKLDEMANGFSALADTFSNTMGHVTVEYADMFNQMIDDSREGMKLIGDEVASGAFIERINSFYGAFGDSWAAAFGDNIEVTDEFMGDMSEIVNDLSRMWLDFTLTMPLTLKQGGMQAVEFFNDIIDEIVIKIAEANLIMQEGLEAIGLDSDTEGAQAMLDAINAEIEARDEASDLELERIAREKEAILDKFYAEQEAATLKREGYETDHQARMEQIEAESAAIQKQGKLTKKETEAEKKANQKLADQKNTNIQSGVTVAMAANELLFNDSKAIEAGIVVAKTGAAVMHQLGSGDPYTAFARAAAAAAMGAVQLAATLSASKGGGGISPVSSSPPQATPTDQGDDPAGASIAATDASGASGAAQNITLEIDGETIASIVYDNIGKLEQDGVIS